MKIRGVLFDVVGTLIRPRGSIGEIYAGVASRYGVNPPIDALEGAFARLTRGGAPVDRDGWERLVRAVFEEFELPSPFGDFFDELYDVFRTDLGWRCFPETREVLARLESRGLPLGIVSNFDARLGDVLEALGIRGMFRAIATPECCGYAKPDPRIFSRATASLELEPAETLMVGDDPLQDFRAAQAAGLQAVLIDRSGEGRRPSLPDLRGVPALVASSS